MSEGLRKFLIGCGIGLVITVVVSLTRGLFSAENAADAVQILCDGFFVGGGLMLAAGGLQWTYNGGVFDGLGYSGKMAVARIRRNFEKDKTSFSEYRENREKKAASPKWTLLAGLVYFLIALILLMVYNHL